ncbi:hypothetical protein [Phytohabitans suffuscus]|uniref:Uncharacterized protein n=1 Tax=Phytohabitans suffuscus TaxID=624315 RepID=A0A6F8YT98_9ACTN|nr:hypothetical protein [Phytohabitans suffuscus]BCB89405.1 hypothetical protein Psuf_067180 [Phytohabitans suffuscus]
MEPDSATRVVVGVDGSVAGRLAPAATIGVAQAARDAAEDGRDLTIRFYETPQKRNAGESPA